MFRVGTSWDVIPLMSELADIHTARLFELSPRLQIELKRKKRTLL